MDTKELMIGDWVKVLPISHKVEPHYDRIESIRKEYTGQICIEGGYHNREHKGVGDWFDWSVGLGYIAPIPLTAEILQKNGFSIKEGGYIMTLAIEDTFTMNLDDKYGQHKWSIIITNGPWNIKIKVFGMLAISIVIESVHELQHALRLVGLNEVADNLKC